MKKTRPFQPGKSTALAQKSDGRYSCQKASQTYFTSPLPAAYDIASWHTTEVVQHPLARARPVVDEKIGPQLELYSLGHSW